MKNIVEIVIFLLYHVTLRPSKIIERANKIFAHTLVYRIDMHARLLILRNPPPARSYFGLHVY